MTIRSALAPILWIACIGCAMAAMQLYASTPGDALTAPLVILAEDRAEPSDEPVIFLFLHERCPCSRATIAELARHHSLLERADLRVVLSGPGSTAADSWSVSELVASSLPLARIISDAEGHLARRYGALTSGHAVIYRSSGELHFSGGLTPSRGHLGAGPGRDALRSILTSTSGPARSAPVFGCPIFNTDDIAYCGDPCATPAP